VNRHDLVQAVEVLVRPLRRRVLGMVRRVVLDSLDDQGAQRAEVRGLSEEHDQVTVVEPYGFTAKTRAGAEGVAIFAGGAAENPVVWLFDRRSRPSGLEDGEVALYNDADVKVHLTADGAIETTTENATITAEADGTITAENAAGAAIEIAANGSMVLTGGSGTTITITAGGEIYLEPSGAGRVRIGGVLAVKSLALMPDITSILSPFFAAIAGVPGITYAPDAILIKAAATAAASLLATTLGATKGSAL
jgi:phage gp45-like